MVPQRDSDANKDVEGSRMNAFSGFSDLTVQTGSILEKQFETSYLPRVFNVTLPWCVGGPDFKRKERFRRRFGEDSPALDLDTFVELMACRCESQMRTDWNFIPGIMSLGFASKVTRLISTFLQFYVNSFPIFFGLGFGVFY